MTSVSALRQEPFNYLPDSPPGRSLAPTVEQVSKALDAFAPDRIKAAAQYRTAINSYMREEQQTYAKNGLTQAEDCKSFAKFHTGPAKGVVVLLHGYSEGTFQWRYIVQDLYRRGYDVFVPALPGHGARNAKGQIDTSMVPSASEESIYTTGPFDKFADKIYSLVKPSGNVAVVGLSAGGVVAARMLERHKDDKTIKGSVWVSPFLTSEGNFVGPIPNRTVAGILGVVHSILSIVPFIGPWLFDALLSLLPHDMGPPPLNPKTQKPMDVAFRNVSLEKLLALTDAGSAARSAASTLRGQKVLMIASDADTTARSQTNVDVAKGNGFGLIEFPASEGVPHALASPIDNPDHPEAVARTRDAILKMVDDSLGG